MARGTSLMGLFLLRTEEGNPDGGLVMARIEGELYALAFSDRPRAVSAQHSLGLAGAQLYYVCAANKPQVVSELRAAGARGFIVDYDASRATFTSAGALTAA